MTEQLSSHNNITVKKKTQKHPQTKQNKIELIDIEMVNARGKGGWVKWVKAVKKYKLPVAR